MARSHQQKRVRRLPALRSTWESALCHTSAHSVMTGRELVLASEPRKGGVLLDSALPSEGSRPGRDLHVDIDLMQVEGITVGQQAGSRS